MSKKIPVKNTSRKATIYRGVKCLNCGQPLDLSDKYCSYCGQLNTTKQLSLKDFFGEFIGSILTYDSRLRYTLKDLLFKPGTITKNYVQGQRLKYANPFRFFLSISIIFFLISGLITSLNNGKSSFVNVNNTSSSDTLDTDSILTANNIYYNAESNDHIPKMSFTDSTVIVDKDTIPISDKKKKEIEFIAEKDLDTLSWGNRIVKKFMLYNDFYDKTEIRNPSEALDSLKHSKTRMNKWIYEKNDAIKRIKEKPLEFLNYMLGKIPFFLFFFTPVFALFFWLIYSKKKFTYMEHMIFIFHIFSFVFLGLFICLLPDALIGSDIFMSILLGLIGPFYFYKALRNFYGQGRLLTIIKFVFLNVFFFISANIAATLFFAITAAVY